MWSNARKRIPAMFALLVPLVATAAFIAVGPLGGPSTDRPASVSAGPVTTTAGEPLPHPDSDPALTTSGAPSSPRRDLDGNPPAPGGGVGPFDFRRAVTAEILEADYGDSVVHVRLAQVDAPEEGECYGAEAKRWLEAYGQQFGTGMSARVMGGGFSAPPPLVAELTAWEAFEQTHDRGSLNVAIVRSGSARWQHQDDADRAGYDAELAGRMRAAQDEAQQARRGLWGSCAATAS